MEFGLENEPFCRGEEPGRPTSEGGARP